MKRLAGALVALLALSGVAQAEGAADWIGRYASELFDDPVMAAEIGALIGPEALAEAREVVVVGEPMLADGQWVAGFGCMAHACGDAFGAVAISLRDRRLVVALRRAGGPARLWGELGRALPGPVLEVLAGP